MHIEIPIGNIFLLFFYKVLISLASNIQLAEVKENHIKLF